MTPPHPHCPARRFAPLFAALLVALTTAGTAAGATLFSPLCQTEGGGILFFAESSRSCPHAIASCRETFWSYATLTAEGARHSWSFQPIGTARLDENATALKNAESARQRFAAPEDQRCAAFFRADRLPSPDLPDAEGWFRYSFEKGQMMIHWKTLKRVLPFQTRWQVDFCQQGCGAQGPGPRVTPVEKARLGDLPESDPAFDLRLDGAALLGFPRPAVKNERTTGWIAAVSLGSLQKAQADLLYRDALSFSRSARDDLLGGSMIAGLLDAALQLDPDNATIRLEYARHFASQSLASLAVRELRLLPATGELKASLAGDRAFDAVRAATVFQQFIAALP